MPHNHSFSINRFPAPEIEHPEWIANLREEDAARLKCLLPEP